MQSAYGDDYPGKRTKILILGAGNAQIDLIRYCKRMGMEVLGCSYSDFDPGIPLLDHFEQINITDVPGVIGRIATVLGSHNINIASMHWGRKNQDGSDNPHAQAFVAIDQPVSQEIIDELSAAEDVLRVSLLELA